MAASFFFYDLETSGLNPHEARIMQFAGQRTDLDLQPVGEPVEMLIKMTADTLPDPDAVMVTGITPQATIAEGMTEAEFLRVFTGEIAVAGTIFLGYNTVRFDDEFIRCLHYRNFYDPYEWQWRDNRGKWDLLDVVRMTRALRPDGIEWPFDARGNATNRLELLTAVNKLSHEHAHDALSDVMATIEVARLIRNKQFKLFEYLFAMRDKKRVAELAGKPEPFIYTSGQYPSEFEKTTVAARVADHPKKQGALVFDLRHDPRPWLGKTADQLAEAWRWKKDSAEPRLPVKTLQYNRCPAVAPTGVLDAASQQRLQLDMGQVREHWNILRQDQAFAGRLLQALEILDGARQTSFLPDMGADGQLYDGFFQDGDRQKAGVVRAADPAELDSLNLEFDDKRLRELLPLYKARNYPKLLGSDERQAWEDFCRKRLLDGGQRSRLARYGARLQAIAAEANLTADQRYLLEELKLYAESIMPDPEM